MRYYSAGTGRFLRPDPAEDGLNLYVYCDNDPLNYVDPFGLTTHSAYVHQQYLKKIQWARDPRNNAPVIYDRHQECVEDSWEETQEDLEDARKRWKERMESVDDVYEGEDYTGMYLSDMTTALLKHIARCIECWLLWDDTRPPQFPRFEEPVR